MIVSAQLIGRERWIADGASGPLFIATYGILTLRVAPLGLNHDDDRNDDAVPIQEDPLNATARALPCCIFIGAIIHLQILMRTVFCTTYSCNESVK